MNLLRHTLRLLLLCLAPLAWAVPTITVDLDVQRTEVRQSLNFLQASTPRVEFRILQNGQPVRGLAGYTGELKYGDDLTPAAGWVVVESSNTDVPNSRVRFDFADTDTNTNGVFQAVVQLLDGDGGIYYSGRINLTILESTANTGAGSLELGSTVDWAGSTYTNTASAGPYTAGTNITFTAGSSGKLVVNSKVVGTAAAGRVLYGDADGTWKALAAGTSGYVLQSNGAAAPSWVIGGGGSGDLTEVQVSGGILSVSSGTGPVPVIGLTSAAVESAMTGTFLKVNVEPTNSTNYGVILAYNGTLVARLVNPFGSPAIMYDSGLGSGAIWTNAFPALSGAAITSLTAANLSGDIPAASFGAVELVATDRDLHLYTVEEIGWGSKYITTNSATDVVMSANTSEQDGLLYTELMRSPRGFTAYATTGALVVDWFSDSTTLGDIRGLRLLGYTAPSASPVVVYSDSTTRNVGSANVPTTVSIDAASFNTATVYAFYRIEVSVTTEDGFYVGVQSARVVSE